MVQLKVMLLLSILRYSTFQFLMVQLKDPRNVKSNPYQLFQFLMVQLKEQPLQLHQSD